MSSGSEADGHPWLNIWLFTCASVHKDYLGARWAPNQPQNVHSRTMMCANASIRCGELRGELRGSMTSYCIPAMLRLRQPKSECSELKLQGSSRVCYDGMVNVGQALV